MQDVSRSVERVKDPTWQTSSVPIDTCPCEIVGCTHKGKGVTMLNVMASSTMRCVTLMY